VIQADNEVSAKDKVETACKKILINPIMENYAYTLKAI
jgi:phosphoribosylformylglycinamidine (FGAM) synthase PurS component